MYSIMNVFPLCRKTRETLLDVIRTVHSSQLRQRDEHSAALHDELAEVRARLNRAEAEAAELRMHQQTVEGNKTSG